MKLSKTARTLLSITALAWSIPLAQAAEERRDAEENAYALELQSRADKAPGSRQSVAGRTEREPKDTLGRTERK